MPPHVAVQVIDTHLINVNPKKSRKLSRAKTNQYIYDYEKGDEFPPIVVEECGGFYTVRDGRHRYQAQLSLGYSKVLVVVYNRFEAVAFDRLPPRYPYHLSYVYTVCMLQK